MRVFGKGKFTLQVEGEEIPRKRISRLWQKMYGDELLPPVYGYLLPKKKCLEIHNQVRRHSEGGPNVREFIHQWEYGRSMTGDFTEHACLIPLTGEFLIFVSREDCPRQRRKLALMHELRHIHEGDKEKALKAYRERGKLVLESKESIQDLAMEQARRKKNEKKGKTSEKGEQE